MSSKLAQTPRRVFNAIAALAGIGLLVVLAFSLNALFAPHGRQLSQVTSQPNSSVSQQISSTPTADTGNTDLTADWGTYQDPTYGYSVRYPPTWIVARISADPEEEKRRVDFLSKPLEVGKGFPTMVSITVYENPSGLSAAEWVQRDIEALFDEHKENVRTSLMSLNDTSVVKAVGFPSAYGTLDVFLAEDDYMYVFSLTPYDSKPDHIMQEREKLFNRILSSFVPARK